MMTPETMMSGLPEVSRRYVPSCCRILRIEMATYSDTRGSLGFIRKRLNLTERLPAGMPLVGPKFIAGATRQSQGQN